METLSESCARVGRGAVAGMIGGAVAAWAMNEYLAAQSKPREPASAPAKARHEKKSSQSKSKQNQEDGDDATVKVAQAISTRFLHHDLSPAQRRIAGPAVHYTYGSLVGALYGAVAEIWPLTDAGFGMLYGIVLWVVGDEAAVPRLGWGRRQPRFPSRNTRTISVHTLSLASPWIWPAGRRG